MIITNSRRKTSKIGIVATVSLVAAALVDSVVITFGCRNMTIATKNSNDAEKGIEQDQNMEHNRLKVCRQISQQMD
jgi:hypothetical protein